MSIRKGVGTITVTAALVLLAGILPAGLSRSEQGKAGSQATPAAPTKPRGKILATVNGEPLYESDLLAGLPDDAFEEQLEKLKRSKLTRYVEYVIRAQFLKDRKIKVTKVDFEREFKEYERLVTTVGLNCCSGVFENLSKFMQAHGYTMSELRQEVTFSAGFKLYEKRLTQERTSPQLLAAAVKMQRARIESDYVRGFKIAFFDIRDPKAPGYETSGVVKEKLANDALARLKKGDSFERVARELSEDRVSAPKGGELGCVRADHLGPEVEQVFRRLPFGDYSGVVNTTSGRYIVMRKKLTEEDILSVTKDMAKKSALAQANQDFMNAFDRAKIVYDSSITSR